MSTLYITEYVGIGNIQGTWGNAQAPYSWSKAPVTNQTVNITGSSSASNPFQPTTILIRVHTDSICSVIVGGTSPVATTTCSRMAANQTEYFAVQPGESLAVISNV